MTTTNHNASTRIEVTLWIVQTVLALLFLFAGASKLVMPTVALAQASHLPGLFLRFIGVLEVLGGLGLVLPGLIHLRWELTPLAAAGLIVIMSGAFGATLAAGQSAPALVPVLVGFLAAFVVIGRWKLAPHRAAARRLVLRVAA
jgi:hypothetical protein